MTFIGIIFIFIVPFLLYVKIIMKNKRVLLLFTFLIVLSLGGCKKDNGDGIPFEPPDTEIVNPINGDTLANASITCEWNGIGTAVEFKYRLNMESWSEWTANTTAKFFLDEGSHTFTATSRNEFNREDPSPPTVNFYIDAITGPALWIKKREITIPVSSSNTLEVWIEDVNNLMLAYIELNYDNMKIKIENMVQDTSFLRKNGGEIHMISEFNDSLSCAKATIGIIGGIPKGVSGSGPLLTINFLLKASDSTEVSFSSSSEIRDTLNNSVSLTGMFPCTIIPEE